MGVEAESVISILALVVAIVSFALPFWFQKRSHAASIRPILVFLYDSTDGWQLKNVGGGPALNVLVLRQNEPSDWRQPVRTPPLASGDAFLLSWMRHTNTDRLGASYEDFVGQRYSSLCQRDLTTTTVGDLWPKIRQDEVAAHWQLPRADN